MNRDYGSSTKNIIQYIPNTTSRDTPLILQAQKVESCRSPVHTRTLQTSPHFFRPAMDQSCFLGRYQRSSADDLTLRGPLRCASSLALLPLGGLVCCPMESSQHAGIAGCRMARRRVAKVGPAYVMVVRGPRSGCGPVRRRLAVPSHGAVVHRSQYFSRTRGPSKAKKRPQGQLGVKKLDYPLGS